MALCKNQVLAREGGMKLEKSSGELKRYIRVIEHGEFNGAIRFAPRIVVTCVRNLRTENFISVPVHLRPLNIYNR